MMATDPSAPLQRVLVTGAAGFVGAAVVAELRRTGREVAVLLRPTSNPRRLEPLIAGLTVIRGDLHALRDSESAIREFAPQAVLHLAWDGVKGADRNGPMQAGNIAASIELYRLSAAMDCRAFVGLGSQAEYGPAAGKLREDAPTRPTTVYGAAKLATCLVIERMAAAEGRRFAWLRLFSSYGCDDDPSWLIPYLINSLLRGERPAVTPAEQLWDYIHVDDVARAVVAAMDARASGVFNLGSGRAVPLRRVMETVRDLVDPRLEIGFGEQAYRPDQVMHLEADITALRAASGWAPRVALEDGLRRMVDWHRSHSENKGDGGR
jgi:nucleoside-diphosphate-sugar epimerase